MSRSNKNKSDWRDLCAAASEERDADKLARLVDQILQAFDERDQESLARRPAPTASKP
jgi:hypothetical protein